MKALEVSMDGELVGVYVPPSGASFTAMVGNIPQKYMRAQILTSTDEESWQWQLPDIQPGHTISFRMTEAVAGSGIPPQFVRPRDPGEVAETKKAAAKAYAKAKLKMKSKRRRKI